MGRRQQNTTEAIKGKKITEALLEDPEIIEKKNILASLQKGINVLEEESQGLRDINSEFTIVNEKLIDGEKHLLSVEERIEDKLEEISNLNNELTQLRTDILDGKKSFISLQKSNKTSLDSEKNDLDSQIEVAKKKLEIENNKIVSLSADLETSRNSLKNLEVEKDQLETRIADFKSTVKEKRLTLSNLEKAIKEAGGTLEDFKELTKKRDLLLNEIVALTEEIKTLGNEKSSHLKKLEAKEATLQERGIKLEEGQEDLKRANEFFEMKRIKLNKAKIALEKHFSEAGLQIPFKLEI